MELKVWVEGIQRIICGVTEKTSCQDVVFALAHATGKIGRFTLIERWRNNERLLAPTDNPLKILMKWGEYSSDVQFILQRSDQPSSSTTTTSSSSQSNLATQQKLQTQSHQQVSRQISKKLKENHFEAATTTTTTHTDFDDGDVKMKDLKKKSINSLSGFTADNKEIGVVKGVQQQRPLSPKTSQSELMELSNNNNIPEYAYVVKKRPIGGTIQQNKTAEEPRTATSPTIEFNSADIRNSLDRKINLSHENLLDVFVNRNNLVNSTNTNNLNNNNNLNSTINSSCSSNSSSINLEMAKVPIGVSVSGALVPPPYRDPPRPRCSPLNYSNGSAGGNQQQQQQSPQMMIGNNNGNSSVNSNELSELNEVLLNNAHYKDLIQLIKFQRDKIHLQQADLTKFDAEIIFLESKERDQLQQLEAIAREINKNDYIYRQGMETLNTMQYIEEENELVRQQEKTLKSEITLLRSKLANCETELLQCKNKVRLLMDEIQMEQRVINRQYDSHLERHFLTEVEKIQSEIDSAIKSADSTNKTSDNLKREVAGIENAIAEKKKQVEQLVNEMKEVNLKSLAVAPSEEVHHLLEGSSRPGSTRKMIGSPRQLENAVPTSKNPHGVWV